MRTLLEIARELASIGQAGLTYSKDPFDQERFSKLRAIAGELLQNPDSPDFQWPKELGYTTPKIDVRGLLVHDDRVLLVKDRFSQKWALPGGWADVNMTLRENVEREFFEETSYHISARSIAAVVDMAKAHYPQQLHSIYKIFLLCDLLEDISKLNRPLTERAPSDAVSAIELCNKPNIEVSEVAFHSMKNLPPLDENRTSMADLLRAYEQHLNPAMPTFFN